MQLPALAAEMAVYPVEAGVEVDGEALPPGRMAVLQPGVAATLAAPGGGRVVVVGGAPLDAPRHMWWNFVSSRKDRIIEASADWEAMRMGTVPGETEFIPLPPTRFTPPEPRS
jgi:redox-sensitive bicupin YhaK (pirin superfamily)